MNNEEKELSPKEKINKILTEAKEEKAGKLSTYRLRHQPPGYGNTPQANRNILLRNDMADINAKAIALTDGEINKLPKEQQKPEKERITKALYPEKSSSSLNKDKGNKKDMGASQEYMMNLKSKELHKQEAKNPGAFQKDISKSQSFMENLRTKGKMDGLNKEGKNTDKTHEPERSSSMSTKFTQSLEGNKIPETSKDSSLTKTAPKKSGLDKDKE